MYLKKSEPSRAVITEPGKGGCAGSMLTTELQWKQLTWWPLREEETRKGAESLEDEEVAPGTALNPS